MKRIIILLLLCAFKVHDGDTFTMDNGTVVRLYGVDAPEMYNPYTHCPEQTCTENGYTFRCADEARIYLEKLLTNKHIVCISHGTSYNRMVGECMAGSFNVSNEMVLAGWAVEDKLYSHGKFTRYERIAKRYKVGVWQGEFEMPWDYRRKCK